ncbi:hypothetical protein [Pectobacterium carotovorum]|uniref:hypothetical protein n=1 Tax=Pectobacterium carotovorum TaxID=554 RepID=UPI001F44CFA9|nr:hypothetical protein [Pectobacterium carotovorum]
MAAENQIVSIEFDVNKRIDAQVEEILDSNNVALPDVNHPWLRITSGGLRAPMTFPDPRKTPITLSICFISPTTQRPRKKERSGLRLIS